MTPALSRTEIHAMAKQAMAEGVQLEHEAYRCQAEAEWAYRDAGDMKNEGRRRAALRNPRMLPEDERLADYRTNGFKVVADAKGDHLYYSGQAAMYASLAAMKFAKAAGLKAMVS